MNFNVNWVFPHPEGPLTMELNGCLQDGSILQNEEDTSLNVILILSFIFHIINYMYSQQNVFHGSLYTYQNVHCICKLYTISRMFVFIDLYRTSFVGIGLYRMSFVSQQNIYKMSIKFIYKMSIKFIYNHHS